MHPFTHFILTAFNVRMGVADHLVDDPTWLRHRFDLFERFCLSSVRSQTERRFTWLVFFDTRLPASFREKVKAYARWDSFVPLFVEALSPERMCAFVRERIPSEATYVLTTRLDSDDALARDFVENVHQRFRPHTGAFLNFTCGYVFGRDKLYAARRTSNPFITMMEPVENMRTVWCRPHRRLAEVGPVWEVTTAPMWLQVVHGQNLYNRIVNCLRVPRRALGERFAVTLPPGDAESMVVVRAERLWNRLAMAARRAGRAVLRRHASHG
ncbi:putative rhamnosyl transferase [Rhodocaloribacter litoris]|uniref:glycosyltransferase n=1 Tax=Rhodocaloribacter litoris TaxID=2558931 RepID=UPI001420441E|nr:glycosyltransferase [Rhodocaloribacter litoris]QXD14292.1 putative rhamnosyl transferase [Rhodocaloribacter litoris]